MGIISTVRTDCKDCYKCVRNCPSKAIKISSGHAEVIDELCILDGRCIEVCPQQAKKVQNDLPVLKKWRQKGETLLASLAPSFPAFLGLESGRVVALLEHLGFSAVQETAVAADYVAVQHREWSKKI
ncbi:MAG: 4Fe-4S binding protein, partial [Halanaerobium sp.]|nr:4Fe-4S binding protein [Halanaerobium sp.]